MLSTPAVLPVHWPSASRAARHCPTHPLLLLTACGRCRWAGIPEPRRSELANALEAWGDRFFGSRGLATSR